MAVKIKDCNKCSHKPDRGKPKDDVFCAWLADGEVVAFNLGWLKEDAELCYLNKDLVAPKES